MVFLICMQCPATCPNALRERYTVCQYPALERGKLMYTLAPSNRASVPAPMLPSLLLPTDCLPRISRESHLPNSPENQLANCFPPMLGVKLSTLSESPPLSLRSGVYGPSHGTVLFLGLRVGVDFRLLESLFLARRLTDADFCVRFLTLEYS